MTAPIFERQGPRLTRRELTLAWAEWVERSASDGPRLLRPFFEAELGFEIWVAPYLARLRESQPARLPVPPIGAAVSRLREAGAADPTAIARRTAAATTILALLGVAAASSVEPSQATRVAAGPPAAGGTTGAGPATAAGGQGIAVLGGDASGGFATVNPVPAPRPPAPVPPAVRGALPVGKGMWIWIHERAEGGDVAAIVARAQAVGLTHLYVRTGTLRDGFMAGPFLDRLLPAAHAAGIRVYAWDFPYLVNVQSDLQRALQAINHRTPDGHRVDGYAADIELRSMGVNINPDTATQFGSGLRAAVGPNYPLIACVPRPSPALVTYPFASVVASFDAVAPMVYWLGRDPAHDVTRAIQALAQFGKPVFPVGQAYDGRAEGGPPGVPPRGELLRFMEAAEAAGATGVSWWSWQHADQQAWDAVRDAPQFTLPVAPAPFTPGHARLYQLLLSSLGFATPVTGTWDATASTAVAAYQAAARLPATGVIDDATRRLLLTPFAPPINPQR